MNFEGHDVHLLRLWQAFQFEFDAVDTAAPEQGDAVRSLIFQVQDLFDSGLLTSKQYHDVLDHYENLYSNIVDEQDDTKGFNNYAEQSIALVSGFRNDSRNWKSSLTFESGNDFSISKLAAEDYKDKTKKGVESWEPLHMQPVKEPNVLKVDATQALYHTEPDSEREPARPAFSRPLFCKEDKLDIIFGLSRKTDQTMDNAGEDFTNNSSSKSYMAYKCQPNRSKQKPLENQAVNDMTEQNDDIEFVTARQQFIINERKKKGRTEGGQNMGSYGALKKSLGYRRGPSSRFIPPVRNSEDNENNERESHHSKINNYGSKITTRSRNDHASPEQVTDERLKGIEPRMVELINNEIMDHGPAVEWHDIAGLEFAKTVIKEIVVWPMLRPDIFRGLRGPPKGLLLFGPPGTGKTLIGKCIASQSKATFFSISASSLTSKWVGEGEKMVRALFSVARCHQPAVIFIDEIDSLLSQRSDGEHDSSRRIKTEFLIQLDGAATSSDDRLLVVGATNRPQEIDEAARRRLVKRLYIPLPEAEARRQIITNLLKDQRYSLSDDDFTKLVERSDGYSGSDMSNLCREAALGPIRSISGNIQAITPDQVRPILFTDFDNAFKQVRASVSACDLDLYMEWNKQFGSGR